MSIKIENYFTGKTLELAKAAGRGDVVAIEALVKSGVNPNEFGRDEITALMWALGKQNKDGVRALLRHGANPNLRDSRGNSPMLFAVEMSDPEFLKILVSCGGNPNLTNGIGEPLTRVAALENKVDNVSILLNSGADINAVDRSNKTLILLWAQLNNFEGVYDLLERGADYKIKPLSEASVAGYVFDAHIDKREFPRAYEALLKCRKFLEARGVKNPGKPGPTKEQVEERNRMIREAFEKKRRQQGQQ